MSDASPSNCPDCGPLGNVCEIENLQDEPGVQTLPEAAKKLRPPDELLERSPGSREKLLKCFTCGAWFEWSMRIPGGSEDVFRTWIMESLRRLTPTQARAALEAELKRAKTAR